MNFHYALLCILSISSSAYFVTGNIAHEGIVGGFTARVNQFPYHVSLLLNDRDHICGGGIIDNYFVITAAHCFAKNGDFDTTPITILAGTNNLYYKDKQSVSIIVMKVYLPMEFNSRNILTTGDIAVLKLKESLELSKRTYLKRLELPKFKHKDYTNKTATFAGFGWNWVELFNGRDHIGTNSNGDLRFVHSRILSHQECQADHPSTIIPEKIICAKVKQYDISKPISPCVSDSGGPLVFAGTTLIGILSRAPLGCTELQSASLYTSASHYLRFIHHAMEDKNTDNMHILELHLKSQSFVRKTVQ